MRVRLGPIVRIFEATGVGPGRLRSLCAWRDCIAGISRAGRVFAGWAALSVALALPGWSQGPAAHGIEAAKRPNLPPRVVQARRFLAQRGWSAGRPGAERSQWRAGLVRPQPDASGNTAAWQPLGPVAVASIDYGLVSGRISSLALDPSDATGNRLYAGTTGGGLWFSQNAGAANPASVVFTPLTDTVSALSGQQNASISVGAVTVQPGGTGVILVGTGDPNDALDSYYGAGILRSGDGGISWSLIEGTKDLQDGMAAQDYFFIGEGFAGFAWSTVSPQTVVAAVSQAYEGTLVEAGLPNSSYEGLYYSPDAGVTWHLARITDLNGKDVQGPLDAFAPPDGNAATSVVWNPQRNVFLAAVRFHGYYQSADGVTWTRLGAQPGSGLTTAMCPTNPTAVGSTACPIFRGTLAVNPVTGDTFAWTVDLNNQDQGLWQDACAAGGTTCGNPTIAFGKQWNTAALETNTNQGSVTIENGDYNLALAAVPSGQDTVLLAGGNDVWRCSLAMSCAWRNTTNANTCMSAQVGGYQHALAWNTANPLEVFAGNDSGLWRSTDAIGETGLPCASADAGHFQNLNGGLGSLAEVVSMSPVGTSPYTMMAGLGVNGTAGADATTGPTADWPEILGGEGGPVAVDPKNPSNWYVNNGAGVSIHLCSQAPACTQDEFGLAPTVADWDVNGDGLTMTSPAPFVVDPADTTKLLIGTCRVWRGPANGQGWTTANAISPMLGGGAGSASCDGNAMIRSIAALALPGGGEIVYVGTYGWADGGATLAGHVLSAVMSSSGAWSRWTDLTFNPVTNDTVPMNLYGLDISSLFIDPHDATGNTVYATVAGFPSFQRDVAVAYSSTDGGARWAVIVSNLPEAPANSLVIDPQDANTAYIATDVGVYATRRVGTCSGPATNCWTAFGTGLPEAPVVGLSAAPATGSLSVLAAATYGRGIWQIPLLTAGTQLTTAIVSPASVSFGTQPEGWSSPVQVVTLTNTGGVELLPTAVALAGTNSSDFLIANDGCTGSILNAAAACTVELVFSPGTIGSRTAQLTISANVTGSPLAVSLSGAGAAPGTVTFSPTLVNFGNTEVGTTSQPLQVTLNNSAAVLSIASITTVAPFSIVSNACGSSVAASGSCALAVTFAPAKAGPASATLTFVDAAGTQAVTLSGTGEALPTDTLAPTALVFPGTFESSTSAAQAVTLTNSGGEPLTGITETVSGPFQVSSNCTTQLTGDSSCAISVTFVPNATGPLSGVLTVSDLLRTQTVALSGTGLLPPTLAFSPTSLSFAGQAVGVASTPLTLTLTNGGTTSLAGLTYGISGAAASDFSIETTTCGTALANGASCTVQVTFESAALGTADAVMTVSSPTEIARATLSGMGFDFTVVASGAATVASGQTASYNLTITPLGGTQGTFSFQCGTLPTDATCAFDPPTEAVGANATGTETVKVATGQSQAAAVRPLSRARPPALPLLCGLLLLPLAWRRRRRILLVAVLLAIAMGGALSCSSSGGGGGGTTTGSGSTTPAGTYSIPVLVTSSGVQHTVTLSLTVD